MNICFRLTVLVSISNYYFIQLVGIVPFFAPLATDNFYVIEPSVAYRSAQLSPTALATYIKKHGIKTVINLRGIEKNKQWWRGEHALAHRHDLHFVNIPLLANRFPSRKQLKELIETFKTVPRPVLIHCRHGRDRTGLAAALWVLEEMKKNKEIALAQLTYSPFGHMSWFFPAMRACVEAWSDLRKEHLDLYQALAAYNPHRYGYQSS